MLQKCLSEFNEKFSTSVSTETAQRVLREAELHVCSLSKTFFVSAINKAYAFIRKTTETYRNNVIFADESKYNIFGSDGRITVWRRKNEELHSKNLSGTIKHGGGGVLVCGCMPASRLGNLVFIHGIMSHPLYLNILRDNLKLSAKIWTLETALFFLS